MSETIGPLAAGRRRRPSTMRRATAPVRTPSVTFTASAAFCRSMPTAAITDDAGRPQGAITPALCWAHARRQFFELADIATNPRRGKNAVVISPIALEAVRRIDALFEIERVINGRSTAERLEVRREQSTRLVADLEVWLRDQRSRLSRSASVAEPIDYMLRRWPSFARFLDDGRICLSNNAAERAPRGFALGRRSWLFAGSERGADRAGDQRHIHDRLSAGRRGRRGGKQGGDRDGFRIHSRALRGGLSAACAGCAL